MTSQDINQTSKQEYIGWHVVAILDLLGQQDALRNLTALPNPDNQVEFEDFKRKIKEFYSPFYAIRHFFTKSIQTYQEGSKGNKILSDVEKDVLNKFRSTPIFIRHFSDSIIAHVPLNKDIGKFPCRAIYGVLTAAALTMVSCLSKGMALRGGIELGLAMHLDEDEIYGPALARAHTLESKIAVYPRIVIGEELLRYIQVVAEQPPIGGEERTNAGVAKKTLELLAIDDDGQVFLDYLGEHFRDQLQHLPISKEAIQRAYAFIVEQSIKHKKMRNSKLGFRYTLIRNYFESRLSLWGLSEEV